mgnify:CR=1 FL=1
MEKEKIDPELKEVILQRIISSKLPDNIKMSIGNMSKEPMGLGEIADHVKKEDEIGRKIIEMELVYLRALKEGGISKIQHG